MVDQTFLKIGETALTVEKHEKNKTKKTKNKTKTITTRTSSHLGKITSPRP